MIGAHKLEGEMVTLAKPFLIMQKRKVPSKAGAQTPGGRRLSSVSNSTTTPMRARRTSMGTFYVFGALWMGFCGLFMFDLSAACVCDRAID